VLAQREPLQEELRTLAAAKPAGPDLYRAIYLLLDAAPLWAGGIRCGGQG